ncbi:hypothetical protein PV416_40330, partial [Streptomyces ipomoeae]|uniref:hypothetical protein n=1 Tax=Streptomyces ipomoeae TaxID=103232 RepID=UPI0029B765DE
MLVELLAVLEAVGELADHAVEEVTRLRPRPPPQRRAGALKAYLNARFAETQGQVSGTRPVQRDPLGCVSYVDLDVSRSHFVGRHDLTNTQWAKLEP